MVIPLRITYKNFPHSGLSRYNTLYKNMSPPPPPSTPTFPPRLEVTIPTWKVPTPSLSPVSPSFTPVEGSIRSLLQYTVALLPDQILSPSSWRSNSINDEFSSPVTLSFVVQETNVTLEVTGYANGQYVVRLLGQQESDKWTPLVAVSVLGHECFGEMYDVPAWKVRETLMEKIGWHQGLD